MSTRERIRTIRLLEKAAKYPGCAKALGLEGDIVKRSSDQTSPVRISSRRSNNMQP